MSGSVFAVELEEEPIELCKLLKILDLVGAGGEAKMLIAEGYVALNGEPVYQKRRKIYSGDYIDFDGQQFQIELAEGAQPAERPPASSVSTGSHAEALGEKSGRERATESRQQTKRNKSGGKASRSAKQGKQGKQGGNHASRNSEPASAQSGKDKKTGRRAIAF